MKYKNFKNIIIEDIFENIIEDAFKFYVNVNGIIRSDEVKDKLYKLHKQESDQDDKLICEIFVGENNIDKKEFRVILCNQKIDEKDFTDALNGKYNIGNRHETFAKIKDISSQVKNADLLAMAELALPITELFGFCRHSAKQKMALITGIEFLTINRVVYNLVATILPIKLDGSNDAVPFLRLKNDYTHEEIRLINGVQGGLLVPCLKRYIYHLYRWRGFCFATYYCFELANIKMRSIFFGLLDFMVVPIWNKDNHYYNAIAEATARDLHCYYIQVNTSEFGETRIIEPVSSIKSDLARVKGGTINDPKFCVSFLVTDLKIGELREAQLLSYELNKDEKYNSHGFKPLPPNWPYENVKKRIENLRLIIEKKE